MWKLAEPNNQNSKKPINGKLLTLVFVLLYTVVWGMLLLKYRYGVDGRDEYVAVRNWESAIDLMLSIPHLLLSGGISLFICYIIRYLRNEYFNSVFKVCMNCQVEFKEDSQVCPDCETKLTISSELYWD